MWSCTGIISKPHGGSRSGGRSGSPDSKLHNLFSILVSVCGPLQEPKANGCPGFIYFATYNYYASKILPFLPHVGTCAGEEFAALTGCVILTSYLFLFSAFYAATYKRASSKQKDSDQAITKDMPRTAASELKETKIPTFSETSDAANDALHATEGLMKTAGSQMSFTSGKE